MYVRMCAGYSIFGWKNMSEKDFWWCIEQAIHAPSWQPNMVSPPLCVCVSVCQCVYMCTYVCTYMRVYSTCVHTVCVHVCTHVRKCFVKLTC